MITDAIYEGYLAKQDRLVAHYQTLERKHIPADLDYHAIQHLRLEAKEKLSLFKPQTLAQAQAARIGDVTPADITVLRVHLKKRQGVGDGNPESRSQKPE